MTDLEIIKQIVKEIGRTLKQLPYNELFDDTVQEFKEGNAYFINEFGDLTILSLFNLELNKIYSLLKDLKNLTHLYLKNNKILDYSFLKDLKNLTYLDLRNNEISDISFIKI